MRGLPSREWRTINNNYGATQQAASSWKDRIIPWLFYFAEQVRKLIHLVVRLWKHAWGWAGTRPSRPQRVIASSLLIILTMFTVSSIFMRAYNWSLAEDPCRKADQARINVLEEEETNGVFAQLPKIIHWETPEGEEIPQKGKLPEWNVEFRRLFPQPEYQHILWSREKIRKLLLEKYPWYVSEFDRRVDDPSSQFAFTRFFILAEYGGLYASLDYQVVRNFWDSLPKTRPALIESPFKYTEQVSSMLMSSPPGHPFWNITLTMIADRISKGSGWLSSYDGRSAVNMLNEAVTKAKKTQLGDNPVYELPCENFNRLPAGETAEFLSIFTQVTRYLMSSTILIKPCGNVEETKCQYGLYHDGAVKSLLSLSR